MAFEWPAAFGQNERIAQLAVRSGIGGLFPWVLNYDSSGTRKGCVDDSLFQWLKRGLSV